MSTSVKYQVMPPLSPDEYQELHDDIDHRGVVEPIHVDESGVVIDGHHRKRIADELGIECPKIVHDDLSDAGKRSLAFTLNLKRRHLNREQRRALIAESLKSDPQLSNREHARRTGADHKTVQAVREESESTGEIPQSETRVSGDGRVRPSSQPTRPKPEPEEPELPQATALAQSDLDELNAEPPTWQPAGHMRDTDLADLKKTKEEPQKPRRTPITDDATRIGWEIRKAAEKLEKLTTDDRWSHNTEKMTPLLRGHLQYAIETATNAINDLTRKDQ